MWYTQVMAIQTLLTRISVSKQERRPKKFFENADEYIEDLNGMFDYCVNFFMEHPNIPLEEYDPSKKILTHWGQVYDIDQ